MSTELTESVDSLQSALEDQGYELYSKTQKGRFTPLVMFHPEDKKFAFIVFDNKDLGWYERVDVHIDIAINKAEAFRSIRSQREDGSIRPTDQ